MDTLLSISFSITVICFGIASVITALSFLKDK